VICDNAPLSAEHEEPQQEWHCRWTRVTGPAVNGRVRSTLVWICEYPYRTMMAEPPDPGTCAGCPVRDEMIARSAAAPRARVLKKVAGL
jgi:hypothetical protein